jgi:hypothetical protein
VKIYRNTIFFYNELDDFVKDSNNPKIKYFVTPFSNSNVQSSIPLEYWKDHFVKLFQGLVDEDAEEIALVDGNLTGNENKIFNSEIIEICQSAGP